MKPFIIRYATRLKSQDPKDIVPYEYDTSIESAVLAGQSTLLIDIKESGTELTGSYMTKADADPTSDEPTDR